MATKPTCIRPCEHTYHQSSFSKVGLGGSLADTAGMAVGLRVGCRRLAGRGQAGTGPDESLDLVGRGGRVLCQRRGETREDLRVQVELEAKQNGGVGLRLLVKSVKSCQRLLPWRGKLEQG